MMMNVLVQYNIHLIIIHQIITPKNTIYGQLGGNFIMISAYVDFIVLIMNILTVGMYTKDQKLFLI